MQAGAALICHKTLAEFTEHPEIREAVCRGFWDAYREQCGSISAMVRLFGPDVFEEVEPPT